MQDPARGSGSGGIKKIRGSSRVGWATVEKKKITDRVGSGQEVGQISRFGSGHPDTIRPARTDLTREKTVENTRYHLVTYPGDITSFALYKIRRESIQYNVLHTVYTSTSMLRGVGGRGGRGRTPSPVGAACNFLFAAHKPTS